MDTVQGPSSIPGGGGSFGSSSVWDQPTPPYASGCFGNLPSMVCVYKSLKNAIHKQPSGQRSFSIAICTSLTAIHWANTQTTLADIARCNREPDPSPSTRPPLPALPEQPWQQAGRRRATHHPAARQAPLCRHGATARRRVSRHPPAPTRQTASPTPRPSPGAAVSAASQAPTGSAPSPPGQHTGHPPPPPPPHSHFDIDTDLHTSGGPIWPSHRLWRDNPEQRAYNESCSPNR